jgi:ribosome-binding factor A
MAREFSRNARVASQLQKQLALVLQRGVKDPRLGFITVNEIEVSKDLAVAKVYVSVMNADTETKKENIKILNDAANYLRLELGHMMKMRSIPQLRFFYDDAMEKGLRITELLNESEQHLDSEE